MPKQETKIGGDKWRRCIFLVKSQAMSDNVKINKDTVYGDSFIPYLRHVLHRLYLNK